MTLSELINAGGLLFTITRRDDAWYLDAPLVDVPPEPIYYFYEQDIEFQKVEYDGKFYVGCLLSAESLEWILSHKNCVKPPDDVTLISLLCAHFRNEK